MLYILYGNDGLGIRRRLTALRSEADGGSGMLMTNLTVLEGEDATPEAILSAGMASPFLGPHRLVIASGLLDRFNVRRRSRQADEDEEEEEESQPPRLASLEPLLAALRNEEFPPSTILVITGSAVPRGATNVLLRQLQKIPGVSIEQFQIPRFEGFLRLIREEGRARGIRWQAHGRGKDRADPVARLAERLPPDTLAVDSELDKLALFTMGREATVEDVDVICSGARESTAFNLVDAVMDGDLDSAFKHLRRLREQGESSQGLLALMASSYRRLAIIQDHLADGASNETIGKAIGLPWPRLRDRAIARARRHAREGVLAAYRNLIEADRSVKRGEVDEDLAVESLIVRLAAIAPTLPERSGGGAFRGRSR